VTKLYVLLDSVTRLLSDRINVVAPYPAPTRFSPSSPPPRALFYIIERPGVSSRQHFISQRARPASQFHFSRPLIADSPIRSGYSRMESVQSDSLSINPGSVEDTFSLSKSETEIITERIDKISIIFPVR